MKGVRIGMDGQTPPTTRVVVDLRKACKLRAGARHDNKIVLKLHAAGERGEGSRQAVRQPSAAAPVHRLAKNEAPVIKPLL